MGESIAWSPVNTLLHAYLHLAILGATTYVYLIPEITCPLLRQHRANYTDCPQSRLQTRSVNCISGKSTHYVFQLFPSEYLTFNPPFGSPVCLILACCVISIDAEHSLVLLSYNLVSSDRIDGSESEKDVG